MSRSGEIWRRIGQVLLAVLATGFGCAAYIYLTLPDVRVLRAENPKETAFMRLRDEEAFRAGDEPKRVHKWIGYGRISPHLKKAVLVAEDSAFWQHDGIDFQQIKESMEVNFERMEFARGASTITQQLAKNLYLTPSKNPVRKARELLIARRLEAELSKQRILELYLNVIEWGDGVYGAEGAARTHFRKSAGALSPEDAALLAAAIINPRVLNPGRPSARLRTRQQMIMRRMGAVTPPAAVDAAVPATDEPAMPPPTSAPIVLPGQVALPDKPLPPIRPPGGR